MNRDSFLSFAPWVEVLVKSLYWKSSIVNKLLSPRARRRSASKKAATENAEALPLDSVLTALGELGAGSSGIMIVHSSGSALAATGKAPREICESLLAYLGPEGTLAMPAIPLFREEPTGVQRLGDSICSRRLSYDVKRTPPWTGALPKALMSMPGAVRSRHPLNTMVAVGSQAKKMMEGNIEGENPLPCGVQSSWKYCADHDATIVCLGVDSSHSLTMIHVAEDSWSTQWPVSNWYRERLFHVIDGDFEADLTVRERHPKWAINYAERTLQKDLILHGIIQVRQVGNLRIEVCSSARLIDFLISRRDSAYPYWFPFWKRLNK